MSIPRIENNQLRLLSSDERAVLLKEIDDIVEPLQQELLKREAILSDLYDAKEVEWGMTDWYGSPFWTAQTNMSFFIRGDILQIKECIREGLLVAAYILTFKFTEDGPYALAAVDAFIEKARRAASIEALEEASAEDGAEDGE